MKKDWKQLVENYTGESETTRVVRSFKKRIEVIKNCEYNHEDYTLGSGYKEVDQREYYRIGNYLYGVQCDL